MFGDVPPAPYLHSGGRDLRFPHHENEIAQSQALLGGDRWVQHWLHAGQLNIKGLKMSKSLKNYTTIQAHLAGSSARAFRVFCLLHRYHADVTFGGDRAADSAAWERAFEAAFRALAPHMADGGYGGYAPGAGNEAPASLRYGDAARALLVELNEARREVRTALRDDADTPRALRRLRALAGAAQQLAVRLEGPDPPAGGRACALPCEPLPPAGDRACSVPAPRPRAWPRRAARARPLTAERGRGAGRGVPAAGRSRALSQRAARSARRAHGRLGGRGRGRGRGRGQRGGRARGGGAGRAGGDARQGPRGGRRPPQGQGPAPAPAPWRGRR